MKEYEIWSEGFRATGEEGKATFHGRMTGISFENACDRFAGLHPDFRSLYDDGRYWGCRLFDNEADARVGFG